MTTLDRKLAEIAGRADAATDGPWVARDNRRHPDDFDPSDGDFQFQILGGCPDDPNEGYAVVHGVADDGQIKADRADLDFIAHARTDIPALLRLVAVLREQRDEIALRGTKLRFNDFLQMADAAALSALEGE